MEVAGIEPASKCATEKAATCLVYKFILLIERPVTGSSTRNLI